MRAAPRPKPVREPEEVRFVHRVQDRDDGTLDDFVLQRGNAERPWPPVRLQDVRAPNRLRSIRASPQPLRQVLQTCLQVLAVVLPRFPVDSRGRISLDGVVGGAQRVDGIHVMEERGESLCPGPSGQLTYTHERAGRASPALRPERVALRRVALGPPPSLHPLRGPFRDLVRGLRRYYEAVRLPTVVHHRRASLDFAMRSWFPKTTVGSPGSLTRCVRACVGSSTAQGLCPTRDSVEPSVAFRAFSRRRHPGLEGISRLNTQPTRPPVNASPPSLRASAHDSGPMWLARPSSSGSFIRNTSPVFPAHENQPSGACLTVRRRLE
jgi:hypothetical protein